MAKPQLTIAQLRILAKLNQALFTVSEMAEWQGVSAPAMSKMVGILEKRGLGREKNAVAGSQAGSRFVSRTKEEKFF